MFSRFAFSTFFEFSDVVYAKIYLCTIFYFPIRDFVFSTDCSSWARGAWIFRWFSLARDRLEERKKIRRARAWGLLSPREKFLACMVGDSFGLRRANRG